MSEIAASRERAGLASRPASLVFILCPGGLENSGGIGRAMSYLLNAWAAQPDGPDFRLIDTRGPGSILWAPFWLLRALLAIAGAAMAGRLALLHINLSSRGSTLRKLIVVALVRLVRVPFVIHLHGSNFDVFYNGLPGPARSAVRWMFRRARRVVVLGGRWQRFAVETLGVPRAQVEIVYNGVPRNGVARPAQPARPAPEGPRHVLFLGRLGERKGVPELLRALADPRVARHAWRATLAGDGEVERFRQAARRLGLGDRIALPGWVAQHQVQALLSRADMLVLPSHAENLPLAVLEALASGVPVIATPAGALGEFLQDDVSALVVPFGDSDRLAEALDRMLGSAELRARLAGNGLALFRSHFDVRTVAQQVLRIYAACGVSLRAAGAGR